MQVKDGPQLADTASTSEESSTKPSLTKQSAQELSKLLRELNKEIVRTALSSVEGHEFVTRQFKRQLMRKQAKHTKAMLRNLSDSEKLSLLDDLRSKMKQSSTSEEKQSANESLKDSPEILVPSKQVLTP